MKNRHLRRGWAAALVLLPLAVVACGDDADDADDAGDDPATAPDTTESPDAGEPSDAPSVVEVVAVDFAYEGLPASLDAGATLTLRNDAPSELHELVAFRLGDDETRPVEEIMALPQEELEATLGLPSTVIIAPPGSEQVAVPIGDGSLAEPGRYVVACFIPTGVDPGEYLAAAATSDGPPDVGDGPPHIVHGMFAELDVR